MQYTQTAITGAAWLTGVKVFTKALSVAKYFVVAKIISPSEFGLAGVAFLILGLVDTCTETGLIQAFIQVPEDEHKYAKTVWATLALRGIVLALLMFTTSNFISRIYSPGTAHLINLASLILLIKGLANPAAMLFRKYGNYQKEFIFQTLPSFVDSLSTIGFSFIIPTAAALILGTLAGALTATLISFMLSKFFVSKFSFLYLKSLYTYGRWVTVSGVLSYFTDRGDDLVVGKLLGPSNLGLYQMAYRISNSPTTEGAGLIYQIVFPLFTRLQNEPVRLKRGVYKTLAVNLGLSLSLASAIFLLLPAAIPIILTPAWTPVIPIVNIMLVFGVVRSHISVGMAYFDAVGLPSIATITNFVKLLFLLILVIPLTWAHGLTGAAWSVVLSQLVIVPWFFYKLFRSFPK